MAGSQVFDEPDDGVLEIVLSSDDEYQGDVEELSVEERRARRQGIAARFLPGVDGGSLLAFAFSVVGLTSSALLDAYATNHVESQAFSPQRQSQGNSDVLAPLRTLTRDKSLGCGVVAMVAVLIAVLVLSRWQPDRHARWSRPAAQAALWLGLLGLVAAVLMYTGLLSGLPSVHDSSSVTSFGSSG